MLALNEFQTGGNVYRIRGRMNGKIAARMLRRCLPIITPVINLGGGEPKIDDLRGLIAEIGKLSDETEDFIFDNCFLLVDRKQGETWAPIKPKNVADLMFDDIDVMDRYFIVSSVLRYEFQTVFTKAQAFLPMKEEAKG